MGMQVWLPLNGTLENRGKNKLTIENNGATIDTDGKIGSCYSFDGSSFMSITGFSFGTMDEWTMAFWVYSPNGTTQYMFAFRGQQNVRFTFNSATVGFQFRDSAHSSLTAVSISQPDANTWTHYCIVYYHGAFRIYKDGVLTNNTSGSGADMGITRFGDMFIGKYQTSAGSSYFTGKINDFRIYDRALSTAEARALSLGLIRHYKFDGGSELPNWLISAKSFSIKCSTTANTLSDRAFKSELLYCEDTHYYLEMDARTSMTGLRFDAYFRDADGNMICHTGYKTLSTEWKHYRFALTGSPATMTKFRTRCLKNTSAGDGDYIYIRGMRLVSDNMPVEENIHDSSGYGNTGIINGFLSYSSDSVRYDRSLSVTNSSGAGTYIMAPDLPASTQTVSCWVKVLSISGSQFYFASANPNIFLLISGNYTRLMANEKSRFNTSNYINVGEWNHFVILREGEEDSALYINGRQVTKSTTTTTWANTSGLYIGRRTADSYPMQSGLLSDFRAYVTKLSASDILALYNTRVKIDNIGGVHAYRFDEKNNNKFYKSGIIETNNISEALGHLHYDREIHVEPDGSLWAHIGHHNNPADTGLFNSDDDFAHGVYYDEDKWYDVEQVISEVNSYEFLVLQQKLVTSAVSKYRWVQETNPLTATWADVVHDNVTIDSSEGYVDTIYGGMYLKNNKTRMCFATSTESNFYGFGEWTLSSSATPGYPNITITTGCIDLYIRIDPKNTGTKIIKGSGLSANQIIEI